jgi:hypothetical protein
VRTGVESSGRLSATMTVNARPVECGRESRKRGRTRSDPKLTVITATSGVVGSASEEAIDETIIVLG